MKKTFFISFLVMLTLPYSWANRSEKLRKNIAKREIAQEKVKEKKRTQLEKN